MHRRLYLVVVTLALASGLAAAQGNVAVPAPRFGAPAEPGRQPLRAPPQAPVSGLNGVTVVPNPAIVRPTPRINRNPAFREDLPPATAVLSNERMTIPPQTTDSSRVTLVPQPSPCDPRNSTTRPVRIPESDNPAASPCAP